MGTLKADGRISLTSSAAKRFRKCRAVRLAWVRRLRELSLVTGRRAELWTGGKMLVAVEASAKHVGAILGI